MRTELLSAALRHDRALTVAALAAVIAAAWAYLLLGAGIAMPIMDKGGGGSMMAMRPEWTAGYTLLIFVMWVIMMAAMMLPSAAPTVLLVTALQRRKGGGSGFASAAGLSFASGYLIIWSGFSLAATLLQWALDRAGMLSAQMAVVNAAIAGLVLIAAGLYQWTPLKNACLRHCQSPIGFLVRHWRRGVRGAIVTGIRHGIYCLGCCWMLMALLFVAGLMNLVWVAGIALFVMAEKVTPWGGRMARLAGALLVLWGAVVLIRRT